MSQTSSIAIYTILVGYHWFADIGVWVIVVIRLDYFNNQVFAMFDNSINEMIFLLNSTGHESFLNSNQTLKSKKMSLNYLSFFEIPHSFSSFDLKK